MISATRLRILNSAREQFYRHGIKRITMDDIARQLGISKKTLYKEYDDKNTLLKELTETDVQLHRKNIAYIAKHSENAVDEIIQSMRYMGETFSKINPSMMYDLQRYYHEANKVYEEFKASCIKDTVRVNLKRGIKEELYRSDIDINILSQLRLLQLEVSMNADFFPPHVFNFVKVQMELIKHFLFGIATLKGHKLINKMLNVKEKE